MSDDKIPKWLCRHEAAHAVAAIKAEDELWRDDWSLTSVAINTDEGTGCCEVAFNEDGRMVHPWRLIVALAGPAGERVLSKRRSNLFHDWDDLRAAESIAENIDPDDTGAVVDHYHTLSTKFVRQNRAAIEAVAEALREKNILTGDEVANIVYRTEGA
jgi:hypothetical protein